MLLFRTVCMPKLIVVTGLPGSGKSFYISYLVENGEVEKVCAFDDFHACAHSDSSAIEDSRYFSGLIACLREGKDCVVTDIKFCSKDHRERLLTTMKKKSCNFEFDLRCFENKPEICKQNVRNRNRKSVKKETSLIDEYAASYEIPSGATILAVWGK